MFQCNLQSQQIKSNKLNKIHAFFILQKLSIPQIIQKMLNNARQITSISLRIGRFERIGVQARNSIKLDLNPQSCNKIVQSRHLTKNIKFSYFTAVDKPIQSVALNSVIELGTQVISYPFYEWSLPSQVSVILGGIVFRIMIELASKFIQEMKFANHQNRLLYKMVQKIFLVDLQRDIKFYQLDHRKAYLLQKYYKVSFLLKNLFTGYLSLNFLRACHFVLDSDQFSNFQIHTVWVPALSSHDPKFILPALTMGLTYLWVAKSRHPFLIHLVRPQNFLYRLNLAFMSGLIFVPLPTIYALGYMGLLSGHLLIRTVSHEGADLRQEWRDIFGMNKKFIEERQQKLKKQAQHQKKLKDEASIEQGQNK